MDDQSNMPVMPAAPESFFQVWIKAVTKPSEQTYADLAASPNAKANTAYLWLFVAALIQFFLTSLVQGAVMKQMMGQFGGGQFGQFSQLGGGGILGTIITAVCGAPVAAIFLTLFFALDVAVIQWIAKMFGGKGNYTQLLYVWSAIAVPYMLVSSVLTLLAAIPYVGFCFGLVSLLAVLYLIFMNVTAIKGVNQFGWGQAIGSVLIPGLVIGFICGCLVFASFLVLGPIIDKTFQGIQQGIQ
jgi:hypothetical protein